MTDLERELMHKLHQTDADLRELQESGDRLEHERDTLQKMVLSSQKAHQDQVEALHKEIKELRDSRAIGVHGHVARELESKNSQIESLKMTIKNMEFSWENVNRERLQARTQRDELNHELDLLKIKNSALREELQQMKEGK